MYKIFLKKSVRSWVRDPVLLLLLLLLKKQLLKIKKKSKPSKIDFNDKSK